MPETSQNIDVYQLGRETLDKINALKIEKQHMKDRLDMLKEEGIDVPDTLSIAVIDFSCTEIE